MSLTREHIRGLIPKIGRQALCQKRIEGYIRNASLMEKNSYVDSDEEVPNITSQDINVDSINDISDVQILASPINDGVFMVVPSTPSPSVSTNSLEVTCKILKLFVLKCAMIVLQVLGNVCDNNNKNVVDASECSRVIQDFDLKALLLSEARGVAILNSYKINGHLDTKCRNVVVELVITHSMKIAKK